MLFTADFDGSLELDQNWLTDKHFTRLYAESSDFLLGEIDLFAWFFVFDFQELANDLVYIDFDAVIIAVIAIVDIVHGVLWLERRNSF